MTRRMYGRNLRHGGLRGVSLTPVATRVTPRRRGSNGSPAVLAVNVQAGVCVDHGRGTVSLSRFSEAVEFVSVRVPQTASSRSRTESMRPGP